MLRSAIDAAPGLGHLLGTWGARVVALRSVEEARRAACADLLVARTAADEAHAAAAYPHAAATLLAAFDSSVKREHRLHAALADGRSRNSAAGGEWRLLTALHPIIALTCDEAVRHLPSQADGAPPFDVVVFDEASQIPTQQSLGCVGRAAQCIIAGDDRQLPPAGGLAGLLDDCLGSGLPLIPLEVHYRSASQSLIAVSNALFYHGSLASFPSAHDFALSSMCTPIPNAPRAPPPATPSAAPSARGLCRVRVQGGMMSNYSSLAQDEISAMLNSLPLRDRGAAGPRYTGSPQGFVNPQQAAVALNELASYLRQIPPGEPMSVGIITLNRPQRSLIHTMVDACKATLGLEPLADHAWRRNSEMATTADATLFIQSIDQIQGEERDLIIFSTLLAPRTASVPAGPLHLSSAHDNDEGEAAVGHDGEARNNDGDADDQDIDRLEVEHEASQATEQRAEEDASGTADNPAAAAPPPARRAQKGSRVRRPAAAAGTSAASGSAAPRFSYSTIAHPHGDRLLNVGLTRAVRSMLVLFHPRMLAPPEHHPAPGKRAWGWLVRYLLAMPPRCACEQCTGLFAALVPPSPPPASARELDSLSLAETIRILLKAPGEQSTGAVTELGGGGGSRSLVVSVAYGRLSQAPPDGQSSMQATALLCDDARDQAVCVRDRFGLLPEVLRQKKAGWERVGLVSSLDLLGAFSTCARPDGAQLLRALREASVAALLADGNRCEGAVDADGGTQADDGEAGPYGGPQSQLTPASPARASAPAAGSRDGDEAGGSGNTQADAGAVSAKGRAHTHVTTTLPVRASAPQRVLLHTPVASPRSSSPSISESPQRAQLSSPPPSTSESPQPFRQSLQSPSSISDSPQPSQLSPPPPAQTPPIHSAPVGQARDARTPPLLQDSPHVQGSASPLPMTSPSPRPEDSPPPLPEDSPPPSPQTSPLPFLQASPTQLPQASTTQSRHASTTHSPHASTTPSPDASPPPLPEGSPLLLPSSPLGAGRVKPEPAAVTRRPKVEIVATVEAAAGEVEVKPAAGRGGTRLKVEREPTAPKMEGEATAGGRGRKAPARPSGKGSSRQERTHRAELSRPSAEPPSNIERSSRPRAGRSTPTCPPSPHSAREPKAKDKENRGPVRDALPRPQAAQGSKGRGEVPKPQAAQGPKGRSFVRFNSRADRDSEGEDDGSDLEGFIKGGDESASESEASCGSSDGEKNRSSDEEGAGKGEGSASDDSSSEGESDGSDGGGTSGEDEGGNASSGSGESGVEARCAAHGPFACHAPKSADRPAAYLCFPPLKPLP